MPAISFGYGLYIPARGCPLRIIPFNVLISDSEMGRSIFNAKSLESSLAALRPITS